MNFSIKYCDFKVSATVPLSVLLLSLCFSLNLSAQNLEAKSSSFDVKDFIRRNQTWRNHHAAGADGPTWRKIKLNPQARTLLIETRGVDPHQYKLSFEAMQQSVLQSFQPTTFLVQEEGSGPLAVLVFGYDNTNNVGMIVRAALSGQVSGSIMVSHIFHSLDFSFPTDVYDSPWGKNEVLLIDRGSSSELQRFDLLAQASTTIFDAKQDQRMLDVVKFQSVFFTETVPRLETRVLVLLLDAGISGCLPRGHKLALFDVDLDGVIDEVD